MENTKSRLVYSGTVNMTEKRDNKGNPTGLAGSCTMPLILADGQQHQCVVIPIDQNPAFFVSPKTGAVTLDINVYENGAPNRAGNTHFIRASVGSKGKQMSDEARRLASPIIGNLKPFDASQKAQQGGQNLGGGYTPYQQAPQGGYAPQQGYNPQGVPQGYAPQGAPQQGYNPQGGYPQGAPQQGYSPAPQNARQQGFQQAPQGGYLQGAPQLGFQHAPQGYNPQGAPQQGYGLEDMPDFK